MNCWVLPATTDGFNGEIVTVVNAAGAGDAAVTVTVVLAVLVTDPLVAVTVTVVVPAATAVNRPELSIVPTEVSLLDQDNVALIGALF